jgi:hypothetical protein
MSLSVLAVCRLGLVVMQLPVHMLQLWCCAFTLNTTLLAAAGLIVPTSSCWLAGVFRFLFQVRLAGFGCSLVFDVGAPGWWHVSFSCCCCHSATASVHCEHCQCAAGSTALLQHGRDGFLWEVCRAHKGNIPNSIIEQALPAELCAQAKQIVHHHTAIAVAVPIRCRLLLHAGTERHESCRLHTLTIPCIHRGTIRCSNMPATQRSTPVPGDVPCRDVAASVSTHPG